MFGRGRGQGDAAKRMRRILRDRATSPKAKAQALIELYSDLFPLGDQDLRHQAFTEALRLYDESGDPRGKDEILGRVSGELVALAEVLLPDQDAGLGALGDHLHAVGIRLDDPDLARMTLDQALVVHKATGNLKGQADAISRLCALDLSIGVDPAAAQRAVELYRTVGDDRGLEYALHLAATAAGRRGAVEEQKGYLEEALRLARAGGDVDGEVSSLLGLANTTATGERDLPGALPYLIAARELIPRLTEKSLGGVVLGMIASAELAAGNLTAAEQHLRSSIDPDGGNDPRVDASSRKVLADIAGRQGRLDDAAQEALEEVRLLEQQRRRIGDARNQARWYREHIDSYQRALAVVTAAGAGDAALEIIESQRAQGLAATLGGDVSALAAAGFDFDAKMDKLLRNIATFEDGAGLFQASDTMSAETADGWTAMIAEAREQDHAALADLVGTVLLRRAGRVESIDELRAKLGSVPHAVVYDLEWAGDRALVRAVWVPPLPGEPTVHEIELDREQSGWIRAFADPNAVLKLLDQPTHPWQQGLSTLIPAPLQAELIARQGSVDLVIVPAAEMWALPFAGLTIGAGPLLDLATITLAPSLAVAATASTRKVRRVRKAVALLDPGLRGTAVERETLAKHFQLTEVVPMAGYLMAELQGQTKYELGVVSAHGDHVRGLAHSVRIGAKGRLFAGVLLRCEVPLWWVMGACWSGGLNHEAGQEPISLPTVALLRGARAVIGALHRVPDRATGRIFADMYRGLAAGATAPAALRAAQRDYRASTSCRLVDWAPLVSIGAPGSR